MAYRHAEEFGNYIVEIVTIDELSKFISKKNRWLEGLKNIIAHNIAKVDSKSNGG
jgi:hypothetical protein